MSRHRPFVFGCGFNGFGQLLLCDENNSNTPSFSSRTPCSEMANDTSTQHPCSCRQPKKKVETAVVVPAKLSLCLPVAHCTHHLPGASQHVNTKDDKSEDTQQQTDKNVTTTSTQSEDEHILVKQIQVGWDRILFFMQNDENSCLLIQHGMQTDATGERLALSEEELDVKHVAVSWQHTFLVTQRGVCMVSHNFKQSKLMEVRMLASADQTAETGHSAKVDAVETVESGGKHTVAIFDGGKLGQIELDVDRDIFFCRPVNLHLNVKAVSCGKEHVIILTRIGMVLTFGIGGQGQLGHGDIENKESAQIVEALEGVTMTAIAAGGWHSVALSDIGDVYTWGWNERGQLGLPSRIIREQNSTLQRATKQTSTSCNSSRSREGQTAAAVTSSVESSESADELVNIQTLPGVLDIIEDGDNVDVVNISAGSRHTAVVTENSTLLTWGWNEYGQLGHGDTLSRDSPTMVRYFKDRDLQVSGVVCGSWTTVVTASRC